MNTQAKIYALICPISGQIRYIGYTSKSLDLRLRMHVNSSKANDKNTYRGKWIMSLLNQGLRPGIRLLLECSIDIVKEVEKKFIAHFKQWCKLTNGTKGGDGSIGHTMSKEGRERLSRINMKPRDWMRTPTSIINISTNEIFHFSSPLEASKHIGCSEESVKSVIYKTRNSVYGFKCIYTHLLKS